MGNMLAVVVTLGIPNAEEMPWGLDLSWLGVALRPAGSVQVSLAPYDPGRDCHALAAPVPRHEVNHIHKQREDPFSLRSDVHIRSRSLITLIRASEVPSNCT